MKGIVCYNMMSKREKVMWIVILIIIVLSLATSVVVKAKSINDEKAEQILKERKQTTWTIEDIFDSLGVSTKYLNLDENGLIEEPYFLTNDIQVNPTELQIALNAYNNYNFKEDTKFNLVSKEKIEKEFQNMLNTGEISDILNSYRSWYSVNKDYYNGYRRDIQILLSDYRDNGHSDFEIKVVEKLTPEQINKLDEVYRGEKTIEEIEL